MRVLLVENDNDEAVLLKTSLRRESASEIELTRVVTMSEAIAALHEDPFDAILLDLSLRGSNGQDAVHRVQSTAPSIPIVVLSGDDNEKFAVEILNRGVQDFLIKGRVMVEP
ncbi:MAG: response regulator [Candidatus Rariloculaceae bacterium]